MSVPCRSLESPRQTRCPANRKESTMSENNAHDERACSYNFADENYDAVCAPCYADMVATITEDYPKF